MIHAPVLLKETMDYLNIRPGTYIDSTLNGGGHAQEILNRLGDRGTVLGIECDPKLVQKIKQKKIKGLIVEEGNYIDMETLARKHHITSVDGILFDFGMSSWHIDSSGRGFSFQRNEVLDMRYSSQDQPTAAVLINTLSRERLIKIFKEYGEEHNAVRIAGAIIKARKEKRILTTNELVSIITSVTKAAKKHPATKIFQALRIAVNNELEAIREGLAAAMRLVSPGGHVVAISFHSLEDRIVKQTFKSAAMMLTRKPIRAGKAEQHANPRSRSALLRAWEKPL